MDAIRNSLSVLLPVLFIAGCSGTLRSCTQVEMKEYVAQDCPPVLSYDTESKDYPAFTVAGARIRPVFSPDGYSGPYRLIIVAEGTDANLKTCTIQGLKMESSLGTMHDLGAERSLPIELSFRKTLPKEDGTPVYSASQHFKRWLRLDFDSGETVVLTLTVSVRTGDREESKTIRFECKPVSRMQGTPIV